MFVIDSNTGNIHVTKSLDREEKDQYCLVATALDRETGRAMEPSSEFIIKVQDINDNPPVFPDEPYIAMVPEMANIGRAITHASLTGRKCQNCLNRDVSNLILSTLIYWRRLEFSPI